MSQSTFLIRPAVAQDFPAIDAFDPMGGDRAAEIAAGCMLVAVDASNDRAIGYVSWHPSGLLGRAYITFCAVDPAWRRRGVARRLIDTVSVRFAGQRLFISTETDNTAMLSLFARDGWTPCGEIRGANASGLPEVYFYRDVPA
mgnify:CR=1 FL=1